MRLVELFSTNVWKITKVPRGCVQESNVHKDMEASFPVIFHTVCYQMPKNFSFSVFSKQK